MAQDPDSSCCASKREGNCRGPEPILDDRRTTSVRLRTAEDTNPDPFGMR
jgi:hypothetical protein